MVLYCDNCFEPFEGERCPHCCRKKAREARADDLCFLTEQNIIWGGMLAGALEENGIYYVAQNVLGAGLAFKTGLLSERVRYYVFFERLQDARDIVTQICPSPDGGNEDGFEEDDFEDEESFENEEDGSEGGAEE